MYFQYLFDSMGIRASRLDPPSAVVCAVFQAKLFLPFFELIAPPEISIQYAKTLSKKDLLECKLAVCLRSVYSNWLYKD